MSGQTDHESGFVPAQRCGESTGNPYAASDDRIVCVHSPGHEASGIDHESPDGTRW